LIAPLEALLPSGRCQLKVEDASVETEKLALSEDLINNSIVGNALFGLSQSAACTRDWMKGLLQQQARYPALEHLMFANIQTKLDSPRHRCFPFAFCWCIILLGVVSEVLGSSHSFQNW